MENQSTKYGDVKKCPQCGAPVEPMAVKCSTCGYEFRNVEAMHSSQLLADMIEAINLAYRDKGAGFMGKNETQKWADISQTIRNFPIPTTKEDLLDFTITLQSKWKNDTSLASGAYKAKYDECVNKAKALFANDPSFAGIFEQSKKDKWVISKQKKSLFLSCFLPIIIFILLFAAIIFGMIQLINK